MRALITERIARYNEQRLPGEPEMTQRRLAALLGVTEGAVSLWTNGRRPVPLRMAFRIAEVLGCGVDDLFAHPSLQNVNPHRDAP
ncbi:MAG: helix-turn-helix transcriptional regulator [Spirochaetales bacterium]|nr:helix-turn-helix transcriptional regulator [Spirochaetales bacterium]